MPTKIRNLRGADVVGASINRYYLFSARIRLV